MKKRIAALLLVCLVLFSSSALALADYGAYFRANQRIATRNGPGTQYRGCATYNLQGQQVHLLSYEYDKNNVCWVEFEFFYKGSPMRLYTGLKRFDATTYDLYQNDVFEKYPLGFRRHQRRGAQKALRSGHGCLDDRSLRQRQDHHLP